MTSPEFPRTQFPCPTGDLFHRIIEWDWYEGITGGAVCSDFLASAFRFDILAWGPFQERRIFAFSPIANSAFEEIVSLLARLGQPKWPRWDCLRWPWEDTVAENIREDLERILSSAGRPAFVMETESMFEMVYSIKRPAGPALELLPVRFDGYPASDNYGYWHDYLGQGA